MPCPRKYRPYVTHCLFIGTKAISWQNMLDEYVQSNHNSDQDIHQDTSTQFERQNNIKQRTDECSQSIFVEPMKWMGSKNLAFTNSGSLSEKIFCGKCNSKVGTFGWLNGVSCPCGVVMGPPGFLIQMSRIDRCTMLKDVEASI